MFFCVCVWVRACVRGWVGGWVCVCGGVDHLHRCKTSFDCSEFSTLCLQGGSARLTDTAQRRHCQFVVIQSLISSAYLHQFFISLNGNRLSQVPACRLVSHFYYGLCCIWTFLRTSVQTGLNPLYGFRNLNFCRFRQMERLLLARTKKEFFYTDFPALSSNFRLSDFRGLFVHARCTPQQ